MEKSGGKRLLKLKGKDFAARLNTAVILVVIIAIIAFVNIIADKLPWSYDMTMDKVYTLTEQTHKVVNGLTKPVNITAFYKEGSEDATVKALLDQYKKAARGKINVSFVDAEKNPAAARKLDPKNEGLANDSIVFESGGRIKKLSGYEIYTMNEYGLGKSFNGEQMFTGAIKYVTSDKLPKAYFLEGHQEATVGDDMFKLKSRIEGDAQTVETLNLLNAGSVPKDADIVVVASPKRDLSAEEAKMLKDYLSKGGKAFFLFDILSKDQLPNFSALLKDYGVILKNNFVVEEDKQSYFSDNQALVLPGLMDHDILSKLKQQKLEVLFPYPENIEIAKDLDDTLTVEPLLRSTDKSWIRYNVGDSTPTKTKDDLQGPATLAVAVTKSNAEQHYNNTKIVVTGSALFINDKMVDMQGNYDFFMNAMNWIEDRKDAISISPKLLNTDRMFIKGVQYIILMVVSILVLPIIAFGAGLFVWMRRRHL